MVPPELGVPSLKEEQKKQGKATRETEETVKEARIRRPTKSSSDV